MTDPTARDAFLQLLQQHKGIVIKICNSYCQNRNDREDLAQEISYQLWRSFQSYRQDQTFSTWMYRVALNVAISFYRSGKRSIPMVPIDEQVDIEEEPRGPAEEQIRLLQSFIRQLKELDRALILLHLESKSYKEIAEILGISETNVATKLSRIRETLKKNFSAINQ